MKYFRLLIPIAILLLLNSCMTVYETIEFNEDGSGSYEYQLDMGELLSAMEGMGGMMEMMGGDESVDIGEMDSVMSMLDEMAIDTLIKFSDLPDDMLNSVARPDLLRKMQMAAQMDKSNGQMKITMRSDFERLSDIPLTFEQFDQLKGEQSLPGDMMTGMGGEDFTSMGENFWTIKKNKILMKGNPGLFDTAKKELGMQGMGNEAEMMDMLSGSIQYEGTIILPGKVKSNSIPNSTTSLENKIIISYTLDEALKNEEAGKGEVKFKMPKAWKKQL